VSAAQPGDRLGARNRRSSREWRERRAAGRTAALAVGLSLRAALGDARERLLWGQQRRARVPLLPALSDAESFRKTMGLFPTPVAVVTALDGQGVPRGLTCSAVCSLSMDPPSMLICVNRRNGTLQAIRHSQGFVVNLLRAGRDSVSATFASPSDAKFAQTDWENSPLSGLPMLTEDALAVVECDLQAEVAAGSHVIVIGQVRKSVTVRPQTTPLVYWCRSYGTWTAPEPTVPDQALINQPTS
jgi:flavin reductase (NADH)